jgi:hypothetical protein
MKDYKLLYEKQKKIILIFKRYFQPTLLSDKDWGEMKALESELQSLEESASLPSLTKERIIEVFKWLLGYYDFPERKGGDGAYWWRKELRLKLNEIGFASALCSELEIKEQLCENCKYSCLLKDNKPCNACNSGEHWQSVEPDKTAEEILAVRYGLTPEQVIKAIEGSFNGKSK